MVGGGDGVRGAENLMLGRPHTLRLSVDGRELESEWRLAVGRFATRALFTRSWAPIEI